MDCGEWGNRRARYYKITATGRRRLVEGQKAWELSVTAMMRVLGTQEE